MTEPLFPFLEANQGALSVAALVLALAAFLWELYRANTQRQRELEQEIEEAIILIEELEQYVVEGDDDGPPAWDFFDEQQQSDEFSNIAAALRALAAAHVKKPTLSLPLLRAAQVAEFMRGLSPKEFDVEADDLSQKLSWIKDGVEEALKEAKRRVVFRRTQKREAQKALARLINDRKRGS